MYLIQKSMSGKIVENKYGRYRYADNFDENNHPKALMSKSIRELSREYWERFRLGDSGMATLYSDGITKARSGRRALPYEIGNASPVVLSWQFAALTGSATSDILVCGKMFKGDMNMSGAEAHSALDSTEGAATGSYGTYAVGTDGISLGAVATADKFLAAADWDAAGTTLIGNTIALGYQYVALTDVYVCVTNSVGKFVATGTIGGHLFLLR